MKKGLTICLLATSALLIGCNKKVTSLYNRTLSYVDYVDATKYKSIQIGNIDYVPYDLFKTYFTKIDWKTTKDEQPSIKDIRIDTAENAINDIANIAKTGCEELGKKYSFKFSSKNEKKCVVTYDNNETTYLVNEVGGVETFVELKDDNANTCFEITIDEDGNKNQFTRIIDQITSSSNFTLGKEVAIYFSETITTPEGETFDQIQLSYYCNLLVK